MNFSHIIHMYFNKYMFVIYLSIFLFKHKCVYVYIYIYTPNNSNYLVFRAKKNRASLVTQTVKNCLQAWVWSLGWKDPLEKGMVTCSRIPVWRIPWTEELDKLQSMGLQRIRHNWVTNKKQKTIFPGRIFYHRHL